MVQRTQLAPRNRSPRAARSADAADRQKQLRRLRDQAMRETRGDALRDPGGAAQRKALRRSTAQSVSSMPLRLRTNPPRPQPAKPAQAAQAAADAVDKPSWWSRHGQKVRTGGAVAMGVPAAGGTGYVAWRNSR
jgi:hypothetical protein